jgi:hypothetical protein
LFDLGDPRAVDRRNATDVHERLNVLISPPVGRKFLIGLEIHDAPAVETRCLFSEGKVQHAFGYATVFEHK